MSKKKLLLFCNFYKTDFLYSISKHLKNYYDIYWLTTSNYDFKFLKSNNISEKNIFFLIIKLNFLMCLKYLLNIKM